MAIHSVSHTGRHLNPQHTTCLKHIPGYLRAGHILLYLSFLLLTRAHAQRLTSIHYNTNNSALPHDICYELMQDKLGYLWISTDDGLVRFDGRDMKIYKQGFRSRYVIATAEYDNTFVISTWRGGVHKLDRDSVKPLYCVPDDKDSVHVINSNGILVYKDMVVLSDFNSFYCYRYNSTHNTLVPLNLYASCRDNTTTAITSGNGFQLCVINDKLIAYNKTGIFHWQGSVFRQLSGSYFERITQTINGRLYGFRDNGIYEISRDLETSTLIRNIPKDINPEHRTADRFLVLPSGNIIIHFPVDFANPSPSPQGAYLFINFKTNEVFNLTVELGIDALVTGILTDREKGFWMSTDGGGIYHVFEPKYLQYGNRNEFNNPFITSLMPDGPERLYIGTKNGIYLQTAGTLSLIYSHYWTGNFCRNKSGAVSALSKHQRRNVMLEGNRVTEESTKYFYYRGPRYTAEFGDLTIITDNLTKQRCTKPLYGMPMPLRDICEDPTGRLWQASDHGLYFSDFGDTTRRYNHPVLSYSGINKLLTDSSKSIWIASNQGLFHLVNNLVVAHYDERNGLSNAHVNDMLIHQNRLWIGTQSGLNMLNMKTGSISIYKTYDGLISNDVLALAPFAPDRIAVGGSRGLTIINTSEPEPAEQRPQLILEHISIDDVKTSPAPPIIANYHSRIILTYNVVTFVYPELVQFQYRLSGNDKWIETQNKSVILTNLESGDYQFQIRAKKYNSSWSDPLILFIEIRKPWWQTTSFYAMAGTIILLTIYLLLRKRESEARKNALVKQQFSELKLKALQTQLNPHFISNALSAIQYFTLHNDSETANDYLTRFANMTRLLLESSRSRFIPLQNELDIIEYYLEFEMLRFRDRFDYTIRVDPSINKDTELVPGILLQPFIENSINHGLVYLPKDSFGHITITITKSANMLEIIITDNGIGREKAKQIQQRVGKAYKSRSSEIIDEIRQTVNNLPGYYLHIDISDLHDDAGMASGTRVFIQCSIQHSQLIQS